jgi:acetate kinase
VSRASGGAILAVNAGSSSLKLTLVDAELRPLARAAVERIGLPGGAASDHRTALARALGALGEPGRSRLVAAGHRVVHGGPRHAAPEVVDGGLLAELRDLARFAPLHMPGQIAVIEAIAERYPGIVQVACFDTAFHRRMPERAQRLPLPEDVWEAGIRRYGFHGLSYEYVVSALGEAARGRVVIAHLGNGASMAAVRDGRPVDTTMGFTPTGGIMMGTRPGDLDPGVLVHLVRERGLGPDALEAMLTQESGLLGVSGQSPDMKVLLDARASSPRAALAVEMFCYRARKEIGALAAALEGLDVLVFTGGIGERAAPVRAEICAGLGHLGVVLDAERNAGGEGRISSPDAPVDVRVVRTEEHLVIARHTQALLGAAS